MGRRALGVAVTVLAVAASVVSSFYVFGADGVRAVGSSTSPTGPS
jgi:hypothetical protein